MLEKHEPEILKYQNDVALLDINLIPISEFDAQITQIFTQLMHSPVSSLTIQGVDMTEAQAQKIHSLLNKNREITFTINLPEHLQNTKTQVELDNCISNHHLHKNTQSLELTTTLIKPVASQKPEGRILPKGKIAPRIEITLHENISSETESTVVDDIKTHSQMTSLSDLPQLERAPFAAQVVTEILSLPKHKKNKAQWDSLTNRSEALEYRKNFISQFTEENHPLPELLKKHSELNQLFTLWKTKLKLGKEQYDALLDVYGQYGASGLTQLFRTWNGYDEDPYKKPAFLETYTSLLKFMPTYTPFIKDKAFQETISKIASLSNEHRSWWMALIQNHGKTVGYSNLPGLFKQFTDAVNIIEQMGLPFYEIKGIKDVKDLPSTLTDLVALLNKCHKQDQAVQWKCSHEITIPKSTEFHFIIAEMKLEEKLGEKGELEWVKVLLKQDNNSNPELIKPAFYRYLAKRQQHLPIEQYKVILDELIANKELSNEAKTRLLYILAKTTSTDDTTGFDSKAVLEEWNRFKDAIINLDSMERLKANRNTIGKIAFSKGIDAQGGYPAVRIQTLKPIMEMPVTPPMSYLNKLLRLSEYKFLDPKLGLLELQSTQADMMKKMDQAAGLYKTYPESMMHAISLIKTETVKANKDGQFFPEKEDVTLLEQFITACEVLTDSAHNNGIPAELATQQALLPLLTTFRLEYETKDRLINEVIKPYKRRITNPDNAQYQEKIQTLLPYSLFLLRLIQNRDQPNKLNYKLFNKIQDDLLNLICRPEPTTKKDIREWIHQQYGRHFEGTVLLDMKDAVDFSALFKELGCTQPEIGASIEQLVSYFDNDEEKDNHEALVRSLVQLERILTPAQKTAFFGYCQEAFKTNGLLSRTMHPGPPTYLTQFQALVDSITTHKAYDEFEQYMRIAQEHQSKQGNVLNTIAKCSYLIDTLYPELLHKGASRKDAFTFSAELVSLNPLHSLQTSHKDAIVPIQYPTELRHLRESFYDLVYNIDTDSNRLERLRTVQNALQNIIKRAGNNDELFITCRIINNRISEILTAVAERAEQQKKQSLVQKFLTYFYTPTSYVPEATQEELESLVSLGLNLNLFKEESATFKELLEIKTEESQSFKNIAVYLHKKKTELINKYANIAIRTNDFISLALRHSTSDIGQSHNDVCVLVDNLITLDNQSLVLSLMYHYSGGLPDRDVNDLIDLFNSREYQNLPPTIQKDFLNAIITQMNNSVKCSKTEVEQFLRFISDNKENHTPGYLHDFYQHAPFPRLSNFMEWMSANPEKITEKYQHFDKHPCALQGHDGREKVNSFKMDQAKKAIKKMPEVQSIFTQEYLDEIKKEQINARVLSTQQILDELKKFEHAPPKNHIQMVIFAAELLHRSKGRTPEFVGKEQVLGRSYELNTTQIISILSILETGKKVTAEIGTGEGKTRIMMILNACQFLKGNTVDFLTSIALAERDYLESLPFFTSLGAEINLITSSSKIEDYKMRGINVSDPENFCLFRNKAFEQKKLNLVINPDPTKRALTLDEADVTYFDVSHLEYNYSSKISKADIDIVPFYPLLMDFFAQSDTEKTYIENKKRCNEQLLAFVETRNPTIYKILAAMPVAQLEKWQDAAYTARHLEYNVDYTVVSEATSSTALGEKKVAAAMCLIGSRISKEAQFADGVHQCLHAELNRLLKVQNPTIEDPALKDALEQCKSKARMFNIDPMRKVTFRSSSNTLLKTYMHGFLQAVTGTIGSKTEQNEARNEFGTKFIYVPRHNGIRRTDRPSRVTQNEEKQLDALVEHILQSRAKNQPVLLICKNDNESKKLHDKLESRLNAKRNKEGLPKLTRIHAGTDYSESLSEANYIKNEAGKPGQVTITTEMEGRGVDIHLQDKAHANGLKVLLTYLPHGERAYGQIIGRSGRYGAIGETQMVLNLESLKEEFGINKLNTDFYLNPEDFIRKLQIFASHTQELRRLFYRAYDNYASYFSERYKELQTPDLDMTAAWSEFLEHYKQSKDLTYQVIEAQLEQGSPNIPIINEQLKQHNQKIQEVWQAFIEQLPPEKRDIEQKIPIQELKKPKVLEKWLKELEQIKQASVLVDDIQEVKVRAQYDPTAAGSVQIVKNPNFLTSLYHDIRAAWRNEGIYFPNIRAWWSGKLSMHNVLSQLPVFNLFISPKDETHVTKNKVAPAHAILFKKKEEEPEDSFNELYRSHPILGSSHNHKNGKVSNEEEVEPVLTTLFKAPTHPGAHQKTPQSSEAEKKSDLRQNNL